MKRTAIYLLAVLGGLVILYAGLCFLLSAISPGYKEQARRTFGTPEAIEAVTALYLRIESSPHDSDLKIVEQSFDVPKFPVVRRIPTSWLSKQFWPWGAVDSSNWSNQVYAIFDEKDQFIAIEFHGSRYGAFVSRDPTKCPPYFSELHRIAEKPVCINVIFNGGS